jgi:hypothetical protein
VMVEPGMGGRESSGQGHTQKCRSMPAAIPALVGCPPLLSQAPPALPAVLRMAASTASSVGLANTSPHTAAVSMPAPTYPTMPGSWPEPPPDTTDTLVALSCVESSTTLICKAHGGTACSTAAQAATAAADAGAGGIRRVGDRALQHLGEAI